MVASSSAPVPAMMNSELWTPLGVILGTGPHCQSGMDVWLGNEAPGFSPVVEMVLSALPSCFLTGCVAYEIPAETSLTHLDNSRLV